SQYSSEKMDDLEIKEYMHAIRTTISVAPLRPTSAYVKFFKHRQPDVTAAFKERGISPVPFRDMSHQISNEWKALSDGEKARFQREAAIEQKAYREQSAALLNAAHM